MGTFVYGKPFPLSYVSTGKILELNQTSVSQNRYKIALTGSRNEKSGTVPPLVRISHLTMSPLFSVTLQILRWRQCSGILIDHPHFSALFVDKHDLSFDCFVLILSVFAFNLIIAVIVALHKLVVGASFVDVGDIYCFGWGLPISTCKVHIAISPFCSNL